MNAPPLRVADVFRAGWSEYLRRHHVPAFQLKAVRHLLACRTPALGGHVWRCASCGCRAVLYNSCRDRHCPTCQGAAREKWLARRMRELIPAPYFHVVFTLPHELNPLLRHNRETLLDLFFREVNATLQEFARDPQWKLEGQLGFLAVLHTWSQTLVEHVHLHCAVPGGAWRKNAHTWAPAGRNWLFRASSLADRFRNRYLRAVRRRLDRATLVPARRNRRLERRLRAACRHRLDRLRQEALRRAPAGPSSTSDATPTRSPSATTASSSSKMVASPSATGIAPTATPKRR
ncbi:MAG: transposase zinc-binding domain-containing protein [Kiritimatiellae bacterium]|nr:transposase zinc-binding domain-containing protein [Kiritimatiellia bacterium]